MLCLFLNGRLIRVCFSSTSLLVREERGGLLAHGYMKRDAWTFSSWLYERRGMDIQLMVVRKERDGHSAHGCKKGEAWTFSSWLSDRRGVDF